MKKTLRPYQQDLLDQIHNAIPKYNKICVQLSTGGGKTVIFTELINQLNSKTLILVDSIDLVNQTYDTFFNQGVDIGKVLAGCKEIPDNKVIVAMVTSLWNRKKKLPVFNYCIVDECHVWIFNKIFPYLKDCKIIGFTATPVRLKRHKLPCNEKTAKEVMSDVYDILICGKPINFLIENNYLVRDENHFIDFDYSNLKVDASGEFTAKSMKEVFQSEDYKAALKHTYYKFCDNKKTMIFTSSTETNEIFARMLDNKNVRTYDSVNNNPNERDATVKWFRNTPDAILINTGCFTKGFDVDDVECIIVARATKSLSLWIQICGRGARTTKKIYKDSVTIIDGGNNIPEHGIFSFDRDWQKIFKDRDEKYIIEPQQNCEYCDFVFPKIDRKCPNCGELVTVKDEVIRPDKEFSIKGRKAKLLPPVISLGFFIEEQKTKYEALKVLKDKWVMFITNHDISLDTWNKALINGQFNKRFGVLLKPYYLLIINSSLPEGRRVVYSNYCNKILTISYQKKYGNN